uniref:Uncharacterized protein n=1 Tax=Tanacetum cinerariifolium TaxID=118510 RepID=A0A6L2KT42_TANCI|nr:hypothetical protein [Tanacetum cinerariifolium]
MLLAYYGRITPFWFGGFRIVMVLSPTERMGQNGLAAKAEGTSRFTLASSLDTLIPCFHVEGPLLDVRRNPLFFLYAWLHRQGVLCPLLESGLLYSKVTPGGEKRCEATYFVMVLHHTKCVVLCVRGTETPEDLLIDGLSRECMLATEDFHDVKWDMCAVTREFKRPVGFKGLCSAHNGHSGIVEAARGSI